jgi:ribosomal protein S18 acetylase RimI-like enzyme
MDIRPAAEEDLAELFEVHREVFGEHIEQIWGWDEKWQRTNFAAEFNSTTTLMIEIDGRLAGYIQIRDEVDRIYLQNIALISKFQSRGFGGKIVEDLQHKAMARGVSLELAVFRTNSRGLNVSINVVDFGSLAKLRRSSKCRGSTEYDFLDHGKLRKNFLP